MPIPYKPISQKTLIEQEIRNQKAIDRKLRKEAEEDYKQLCAQEALKETTLHNINYHKNRQERLISFKESVRIKLLEYTIAKVFKDVMNECSIYAKDTDGFPTLDPEEPVMEAMVYSFINEAGGPAVIMSNINNYGNTTYFLGEMHNIIKKHFNIIIEDAEENIEAGVDDDEALKADDTEVDPFKIDMDEHIEKSGVVDPIAKRVIHAVDDFITNNAKDKANIVKALELTKDKVESLNTDDEEIVESYTRLGKRLVADIRNKPRSIFGEMVHRMTNSVLSTRDVKNGYITEGAHVDIGKIINKVSMMYGFLETVNSLSLIKVDNAYISNVLESMTENFNENVTSNIKSNNVSKNDHKNILNRSREDDDNFDEKNWKIDEKFG